MYVVNVVDDFVHNLITSRVTFSPVRHVVKLRRIVAILVVVIIPPVSWQHTLDISNQPQRSNFLVRS